MDQLQPHNFKSKVGGQPAIVAYNLDSSGRYCLNCDVYGWKKVITVLHCKVLFHVEIGRLRMRILS